MWPVFLVAEEPQISRGKLSKETLIVFIWQPGEIDKKFC